MRLADKEESRIVSLSLRTTTLGFFLTLDFYEGEKGREEGQGVKMEEGERRERRGEKGRRRKEKERRERRGEKRRRREEGRRREREKRKKKTKRTEICKKYSNPCTLTLLCWEYFGEDDVKLCNFMSSLPSSFLEAELVLLVTMAMGEKETGVGAVGRGTPSV